MWMFLAGLAQLCLLSAECLELLNEVLFVIRWFVFHSVVTIFGWMAVTFQESKTSYDDLETATSFHKPVAMLGE